METSNMKNMVVLKNLPSNLVEEAIVILKSSKKVKKLQKIEKKRKSENKEHIKKDYVLKEAEMLVSSYISKLEESHDKKQKKAIENYKNYKRLKKYAYIATSIIIIQAMLLVIK